MSPDKEVNPLWIWLGEKYTQFAIVYLLLFVAVIVLTETLLRYSSRNRPMVGFFTYSLIVFGCQAHLLGALSNIDGSYYAALLSILGIPVTKMLDYIIFMLVFFSPVPLSLVAFRAWQKHHSHSADDVRI
jgi:hypothetical protein